MSGDSSPALLIRFPTQATTETRDRLIALLADYDLVAVHEDDIAAPREWTAHFADAGARGRAQDAIAAAAGGDLQVQPVDVEDDDWAARTQADLPAVRIGRVVVAPPWDLPAASSGGTDLVVVIEPSRGFGTGHHQSTRLCLVLLQSGALAERTVLDIGTGSGVLAIVAARLQAAFVSAIDTDPDAIENARENIARNGVGTIVEAHVHDLTDVTIPPADVVVANLTGTLLARHADALTRVVRPGGTLIVSGFTIDERRLVEDAFTPALQLAESAEEDDWWAYRFLHA